MVIRIERKISDQIITSVSFGPKKGNAETLKTIVCQTAPLAKLPPGGKYDVFRQNADFLKGMECNIFKALQDDLL